jgi:ArsR family transcriptional regulator
MNRETEIDFPKWSNLFKALGHPVRLRIVLGLMGREDCNVNWTMVEQLGLPQSSVSQQLSVLKSSGIISCRKKGVESCYFVMNERVRKMLQEML